MTVWKCKDQVATFNKRSAELKATAKESGMDVHTEWKHGAFDCFMARMPQASLKQGLGMFAECGANFGAKAPYLWHTKPGGGKVWEETFLQK